MNGKFICEGEKYKLGGINNDVIGLSVSFENLPEEIKIQETKLYPPAPFHVSLVYVRKTIANYNILIPDFSNRIVEDFCDFTKSNPIEITRYNNEYKFVNRDGIKKTVIVMCEVSNINKFFDLMNKKYGLNVKYPVTHVTLYNTLKGEPGIYLMDQDDIKNFTTPIKNPLGFSL